ncbi:uncharacterized protein LOC118753557 [Rhagoletis pomonella]|uniref:uncharacterized protein LOC118753557 n=1 Tax=Rhagoletis pomonella TaxID=28610 RepID=UPI00177EF0FE|nr:uncharacterized protein LOC118753557 [Rhagoletis pomonella]
MEKKKRNIYKKRTAWCAQSEAFLLELWEAKSVQLRSVRKNSHILEEMAGELRSAGYAISSKEIKTKMHNLTTKYRNEKAKIGPSGGSPSDWPLYTHMNAIFGSYKSYNVEKMVEDSIIDCDGIQSSSISQFIESETDFDDEISFLSDMSNAVESQELMVASSIMPSAAESGCITDSVPIEISPPPTPSTSRAAKKKLNVQKQILVHMDNMEKEFNETKVELVNTNKMMIEKSDKEIAAEIAASISIDCRFFKYEIFRIKYSICF